MANFTVVFDNASYSPEWQCANGDNTVSVSIDVGNSWSYREVSKGDTVSSGTEMTASAVISALETLLGESVTFDASSEGLKPES